MERIVQTFEWDGMPCHVSLETTFEDLGDRTRVITHVRFMSVEDRDGMLRSGMQEGMQRCYEMLDRLLAAAA